MRINRRFQKRSADLWQNEFNPHRKCFENKIDKRKIKIAKTRIEGEDQCERDEGRYQPKREISQQTAE